MRVVSTLEEFCRTGWDSLPVVESDYPIRGDWYRRFEARAASIIPPMLLPNHLTIFRVAVSAFLMGFGASLPVSVVIVAAASGGLSDFFDGAVARARDKKTRFGILFDPIADKLLMLSIVCVLLFREAIHPALVVLLGGAEAHIVLIPILSFAYQLCGSGSRRPLIRAEQKIRPSLLGKVKMHLYVYGFLLMGIGRMAGSGVVQAVGTQVLIAGVVTAWLALVQYVWRWVRNPY